MKFHFLFLTSAFAFCLSSCGTTSSLTPAEEIDEIMQPFNSPSAPGASVLVMLNNNIYFAKGYGIAKLDTKEKITTKTNFRLASITKQFTAMCIMMLAEQGKLSFNDPIAKHLEGLPPYANGITIQHLLNHTSGLVDYEDFVPDTQTYQVLDSDCLELLKKADSTYFPPGTQYRYSNTGYAFLALIVEKVSGKRFADFLKENIFNQIGMKTTVAYEKGISTVANRAFGHSLQNGNYVETDQSNTSAVLGDGGIYSNVEEMSLWISALFSNTFVSRELQERSWKSALLNNGTSIDYGIGWHLETCNGMYHPAHGGSTRGFRNNIQIFPDQKLMVIILTNRNEAEPEIQTKKIAGIMLKHIRACNPCN